MKRIFIIIICLVSIFVFCSCENRNENNYTREVYTFTESDAETAALKALYRELNNLKYPIFDAGQTTYKIGSIERDERESGMVYLVYGTYTLYDKYGDYISGYVGCKFSATVFTNGTAICKLQ